MLGPVLRGDQVSLEPSELDDLPLFRRWLGDLEVTRYLLVRFVPSEKQEQEFYDHISGDNAAIHWKIVAGGRTIGATGLHNIDWINRHAISGLFIGERGEWGKGYASEVVMLRTAYAFRELGLERLESESFVENLGMHRALEKSGYQKIGRRRHQVYRDGAWHDVFIFELLRQDWEAQPR
jgi:RimJ/RimL family protein N-acetyltransferase